MAALKLFGQEITIYGKIYNIGDFKSSDNSKRIVQEFIEEAESSSSSMPVLGIFDSELKNIFSENSKLINSENNNIEYKVKYVDSLFEPPSEGKILLIYYYLYLSSEYEIELLKEMKEVSFGINNFNNLAILSENNTHIDFQNNSADKSTETYIKAILNDETIFENTSDDQEQLISDLQNHINN